jgi:hypothetical protein
LLDSSLVTREKSQMTASERIGRGLIGLAATLVILVLLLLFVIGPPRAWAASGHRYQFFTSKAPAPIHIFANGALLAIPICVFVGAYLIRKKSDPAGLQPKPEAKDLGDL